MIIKVYAVKTRIDAPGLLHHIIIRRVEKKAIFLDDRDKEHFLDRLGPIARVLNVSPSAVSKATNRRKDIVNYSKTEKTFLKSKYDSRGRDTGYPAPPAQIRT